MLSNLFYTVLWLILNGMRAVGLLRWHVEGMERLPAGGAVLVSNHVHWLDIPVQGAIMPFKRRPRWVAKVELQNIWLGRLLLQDYMIPIRRGKRDVEALDTAVERLRQGQFVLIYPEGTRSHTGILQRGKPGALVLAARSGCPMVPVAVLGTERGLKGALSRKGLCIRFGPPFPAPDLAGESPSLRILTAHTAAMMQQIAALLPPEQRGSYDLTAAPAEPVKAMRA